MFVEVAFGVVRDVVAQMRDLNAGDGLLVAKPENDLDLMVDGRVVVAGQPRVEVSKEFAERGRQVLMHGDSFCGSRRVREEPRTDLDAATPLIGGTHIPLHPRHRPVPS
ncbi:hypothetical protein [Nocardioides nitrophenolicus]|uniref:hypothetical protein n=1 Tax=Nocardioides nitrophenolicus TaxID=60489 RepID=UPI000B23266F|nr:hypothetical protein [Nocardioides nitrophenolicus]MBM7517207.1 hypothetical protein [Nocardioides nitrophenolicus]